MVRVPGRLAKFSLRLSPQPFSGGRIARSLVRRETERRAELRCSQAVAYRPVNQVARGGDGEESGGGVMGGKLLIRSRVRGKLRCSLLLPQVIPTPLTGGDAARQ